MYELLSLLAQELQKVEFESMSFIQKFQSSFSPFVIPVPVKIEVHTVPDFKAAINTKVEPEQLGCDSIFISY